MSQLSIFDNPEAKYTQADLDAAWKEQVHTYNEFNKDRKDNNKAAAYLSACKRYETIKRELNKCKLNSH